MVEEILQKLGLSPKEAKVYLTLYRFGSIPAGSLAKRSGLNRGTVYSVIKVLQQKGFVYSSHKKEVQHFIAVEPTDLVRIFEKKEQEIEDKKRQLVSIIKDIEGLKYPGTTKPKITFYEGDQGIRQIHEKILKSREEIKSFFPAETVPDEFRSFISEEFIKEKKRIGQKSKIIAPEGLNAQKLKKGDLEENRETKIVPEKSLPLKAEITVFGDQVAIISYNPREMMGTLIESEDIGKSLTAVFDYVWEK